MAKKALVNKAKLTPRYSTRLIHRCNLCGRPRSYMRMFGLCRLCFRQLARKGELPGVMKGNN